MNYNVQTKHEICWHDDVYITKQKIEAIKDFVPGKFNIIHCFIIPLNASCCTGHIFHNSIYGNNKKY